MEGIDVNWCLVCDSHYSTTDSAPYCSDECFLKHNRDQHFFTPRTPVPPSPQPIPINRAGSSSSSFHSDSFSELDLAASYHPSPSYPYAASSSQPQSFHNQLRASDWIGRGADGISAWAATIPLGASPQTSAMRVQPPTRNHSRQGSSSSSTPIDVCSDSSSITPPSRPRTRASTISSHTTPARCLSLSASQNRPAPPKVSYINSLSAQSHSRNASVECLAAGSTSPPTPTIPSKSVLTITPYTSLPSLIAQSSASASLTSIATPGSLVHGSRPSSRPVSPPISEHGEDEDVEEEVESEAAQQEEQQEHHEEQQESKPTRKSTTLFSNLAAHIRSWASSNGMTNNPPYSMAHQVAYRPTARQPHTPVVPAASGSGRSKTLTPSSANLARQLQSRQHPEDTIRVREPVSYFDDEELAFGFQEKEVIRMGRGLVSAKMAGAGKEERERDAFRNRGRKIERVWS